MNKTITGIAIVLFLIIAGALGLGAFKFKVAVNNNPIVNIVATSPKDATYILDGKPVTIRNGIFEIAAAPGSASKIITRYFGNEVKRDFDGDGREDVAFILTQEMGGSGTFYYVVAALNTKDGYVGSQGLLLGDRIAPQATEMGKGDTMIIVNYADRAPGESFVVPPSVSKSLWLLFDPKTMQFGEVEQEISPPL